MRWSLPKNGDRRIVRRFPLLPLTIGGDVRWLESTRVDQVYEVFANRRGWTNLRFLAPATSP